MEKQLFFNGIHKFKVKFTPQLIEVNNQDIQKDKRDVYRGLNLTKVAFVQVEYKQEDDDDNLKELLEKVQLKPFVKDPRDNDAILFDMFIDAKRNNIYNTELDEQRTDYPDEFKKDQYRPYVRWWLNDNSTTNDVLFKEWIDWGNLDEENFKKKFKERFENTELYLDVIEWSDYVKEQLTRIPNQIKNDILVVDVRNENINWSELIIKYRKENPNIEYTGNNESMSILHDRPADYQILNRNKISILMMHENNMIGYITCSIKTINKPRKTNLKLNHSAQDFKDFYNNLKTTNETNFVFNIFTIDGIHINTKFQGKQTDNRPRARELFYTVLKFIQNSYKTLGVQLIVVDSEAAATMKILTSQFGFTFFNPRKESTWVLARLIDYVRVNHPSATLDGNPFHPTSLITQESIINTIKTVIYNPKIAIRRRERILNEIDDMFKNFTQEKFDNIKIEIRRIYDTLSKVNEQDKVNSFFDGDVDDQDTFLYLLEDKLLSKLVKFESNYKTEIIIIGDDDDDIIITFVKDGVRVKKEHVDETMDISLEEYDEWLEPTDNDIILYDKLVVYGNKRMKDLEDNISNMNLQKLFLKRRFQQINEDVKTTTTELDDIKNVFRFYI